MKTKTMLKNYFKAITNVASQGDARSEPSPCRKRLTPCIQKLKARLSEMAVSPSKIEGDGMMKVGNGNELSLAENKLPANAAWLFPEYEFESMDPEHHAGVIIERVLERGTWAQARWLFAHYGEARVAEWVRRHGFRLLTKRSFALWRLALGVEDYVAPAWAIEAKRMEAW